MTYLAYALWDNGIAEVFNSPFVIPVAGCMMVLGIVVSSIWAGVRTHEIKSHERLARIAQGLPVEPTWDEVTVRAATGALKQTPGSRPAARANDGSGARRAGVVLTSVGVGLFAFFAALSAIVQVREVLSGGAAGLIPLAIGIGFLVDARLKKREYEERLAAGHFGAPMAAMPSADLPQPPPPPAGMTPAQASDWRPLH